MCTSFPVLHLAPSVWKLEIGLGNRQKLQITVCSWLQISWLPLQISELTGGSDSKESACNAGDLGLLPGLGRSPGEGKGYPPQYSGLENSMDRAAWQATIHGVAKTQIQLSDFHTKEECLQLPER